MVQAINPANLSKPPEGAFSGQLQALYDQFFNVLNDLQRLTDQSHLSYKSKIDEQVALKSSHLSRNAYVLFGSVVLAMAGFGLHVGANQKSWQNAGAFLKDFSPSFAQALNAYVGRNDPQIDAAIQELNRKMQKQDQQHVKELQDKFIQLIEKARQEELQRSRS